MWTRLSTCIIRPQIQGHIDLSSYPSISVQQHSSQLQMNSPPGWRSPTRSQIPARIHTSPRPTNANALAQHSQTPPACQPASPSSSLVVPVSWEKELPAEMPGYRGTRWRRTEGTATPPDEVLTFSFSDEKVSEVKSWKRLAKCRLGAL